MATNTYVLSDLVEAILNEAAKTAGGRIQPWHLIPPLAAMLGRENGVPILNKQGIDALVSRLKERATYLDWSLQQNGTVY